MSKLRAGAATQQKDNANGLQSKFDNPKSKIQGPNERCHSPVNGNLEKPRRSRSSEFFKKLDQQNSKSHQLGEDLRDTNTHGLIVDHKSRNKRSLEDPEAPRSPVYKIGRVLGSGMIGVACLCQDERRNKLKCLKYMSIEKIREKNLFKNIKDEVQIMYELIGVEGVC